MPGGGTISVDCENVTVEAENPLPLEKGDYIKISIKDRGTGISEEHMTKIFDPYFTTKEKGSGLGLATAYSIVKRHYGHIEVESTLGLGTTFHIYLPASKEKALDKKPSEAKPISGKGNILIMDDDELVRDSLGQILESLGYHSEFAIDGREAVEAYRNAMASGQPFDVVIMDLTIPGGAGGKDTIEKLKKVDPNIKAIVSSGYSHDPVMANYCDYGFKAVLTKPYRNIEELSFVLNDVIKLLC
jgi:CheY-like chemotaxis protein